MGESKKILEVLTLAVKCCGLDVMHGISAHSPGARTGHVAPTNHKAREVKASCDWDGGDRNMW